MDDDLNDQNAFYTEVGLQIRDGDQLSLGPPPIVSPCTFLRATSHGGGSRTSPMGVPDPQLHRWTFVHKLVHFVQIVRSQTHFYSAFRYGDQQGVSPMLRCVVSRCSRQCLTILVHIPNHFIAPTVFSSLLMSSNSLHPPPLSCVPSIFSTTPIGSGRVPPVFSSLRLLAPPPSSMQAQQSNAPHSVSQTPILAELPRVRWQSKQWKPGIPSPVELSLC